ncbi:MAG: hypothetical protein ACFFED_00170 [Candidatus Thorarchaeota archaeon]
MLGIYLFALFGGVILLSVYLSRDRRTEHATHPSYKVERESISDKIHHAIVEENMYFDGESQEYADAMSKRRQMGW